jgi:hypothetical protein
MATTRTNLRRGFEFERPGGGSFLLSSNMASASLFCNRNSGGQLICRRKTLVLDTRLPSARRLAFLFSFLFFEVGGLYKKDHYTTTIESGFFFGSFSAFLVIILACQKD